MMFDNLDDLEVDMERETKLDAERVTWEFKAPLQPRASQQPVEELPLFGGRYQGGLFE
jgi:hypothetical protein